MTPVPYVFRRRRVPGGEQQCRHVDRFLQAWRNSRDLDTAEARVALVLAQLLDDRAHPSEAEPSVTIQPSKRLYECPRLQDCLSASAAVQWQQMSCEKCPTYLTYEQQGHNDSWRKAFTVQAALTRKDH